MTKEYLFMYALNIVLFVSLVKAIISLSRTNYYSYNWVKLIGIILDILIIVCVIYLYVTNKYLSLPFLGETVVPVSAIADEKFPVNADSEYILKLKNVKDGVKVIYWGAQKDDNKVHDDPFEAYDNYENVGIAIVKNNKALLKYIKPVKYKVGFMKQKLPRHLHYRLCCRQNIMLSEVHTINLD
jgi:hypothetical protein